MCVHFCYVSACGVCSIEEQTITASDLITQDIDINEPVGNLKKLLEPRLQIALDGYDICLQDIHVGFYVSTCSMTLGVCVTEKVKLILDFLFCSCILTTASLTRV